MQELRSLVARLANRDGKRSEATLQADVRTLLLIAPFNLDEDDVNEVNLESSVGDRRRIDVETGTTVFEIKRDLRRGKVLADAEQQLAGYVETRESQMGRRYVGVITDGTEWRCYRLTSARLVEASSITVRKEKPDVDALLIWLEGVLGTARGLAPTPAEIQTRLGARSSSHALDRSTLQDIYARSRDVPAVRMKRQLWARLLTTALGAQFEDSDDLFVEHTLLVNSADIIAHAVLGLPVAQLSPGSLLSGSKFAERSIHGVVEADFFDWVLEIPGGELFVRTLARRLARFDWSDVEHDVLKVLYESVIGRETRKKLGEYYTPDWLAEKIIETTIRDPLTERVLDPACGSGTFLFHAVRRYLAAAEASGMAVAEAIEGSTQHVLGMDLHPVAVTLARVTYVLALGRDRLTHPQRGEIQIPVYLGDSLQWQQERLELWSAGHLVIQADEERRLFSSELRFPDALLADAHNFDLLVQALANKASKRKQGSPVPSLAGVFHRHPMSIDARKTIEATFHTMCRLHDEGRDHIWGYYIRNLARPVWLAHANRVDIIVGNPPWLAYRHMTRDMQAKFREMSESRNLWHGAKVATHQDLSGLFVARIIQLYLRKGGRFGLVMPNAVLDRAQFAGFRKGDYPDPVEPVSVAFERSWDLKRLRPHFFPRGAAVIFGERTEKARRMSETVESWAGQLPSRAASWSDIEHEVERRSQKVQPIAEEADSPYRSRFRQGASLVPRMLLLVERLPAGPLGIPAGQVEVRSMRSANEKPPWKGLDALDGVVESEFVSPVYLGENVLPYRILPARNAIIPWDRGELLTAGSQRLDLYPGLAKWWHEAHEIWRQYRASNRLSLDEQVDYHNKLSSQHPIQPQRIVYTKSGMHLSAAPVADRRAVIDHTLYWATATSRDESLFLCAILNAATVTQRIRPLMSYGKDERHIDKHVWRLAIPLFDPTDGGHMKLVALAAQVEKQIKELPLEEGKHFAALRRQVREHLEQSPEAQAIERLVAELLGE